MAEPERQRYFAGLSRNTFVLACASLFADISTEMLYPVLPVFLTQVLNASGSAVGLIDGVAQATQNIVQGLSGWLSDRLRKRKPIALAGYLLAAVAKPLMGVSTSWEGVLGGRFLDRLGTGARSAPRDALIASSADEEHRGKALVPGLLAVLMIVLVTERQMAIAAKSKLDIGLRQFPAAYWKYLLVTAVFGIGNSSNAFLILQTQAIGASLEATILIYAAFNLVAALISYPAGFLSDRWGRRNILLASFVIFFIAYLGFALTGDMALIAALFVFYGLYQGIFRTVGKALATDFVPEHLRASGVGWYNATVGLLGLLASIAAGLLWDHVGHGSVFLFGAALAVIGGIALVVMLPAKR
jgi:MFS family permease